MKNFLLPFLLLAGAASAAGPFTDFREQRPGARHRIAVKDMPAPDQDQSVRNGPSLAARPAGALPLVPRGYAAALFAGGFRRPRQIRLAPGGDLFLAESGAGRIVVLRPGRDGAPEKKEVFAEGLEKPFGIAFFPPGPDPKWVYVGDTGAVVRYPYANGDLRARGKAETIAKVPSGGNVDGGGHWTRDVAFSRDGKTLFVSVGSFSNVNDPDDHPEEHERADVLAMAPDGSGRRVYASGLRNAVGLAVDAKGALWASVNERDNLGDDLPPDYITRVKDGGFYGWPWYYIGGHQDPRHLGKHPELREKTLVPDVLIQPHDASLGIVFDADGAFGRRGDLFAAEHGSWNRARRTGYEVIRVPMKDGRAQGGYEDFMTGFVLPDGRVWGRPVGVAFGRDGALYVTDDAGGVVWRVSRTGGSK